MIKKDTLKIINDSIGRLIMGEVMKDDEDVLLLKNPFVVTDQQIPDTNNPERTRMQVVLLPVCYYQILEKFGIGSVYKYNKCQIVENDAEVTENLARMYEGNVSLIEQAYNEQVKATKKAEEAPEVSEEDEGKVVKLFDDKGNNA